MEESFCRQEPHLVVTVYEEILHLVIHPQRLELIDDIMHKHLIGQVDTRQSLAHFQPEMVVLVEILMGMTVVFRQRIRVFCGWVDKTEFLSVVKVYLPHRGDD